jgi:hypothetical protein
MSGSFIGTNAITKRFQPLRPFGPPPLTHTARRRRAERNRRIAAALSAEQGRLRCGWAKAAQGRAGACPRRVIAAAPRNRPAQIHRIVQTRGASGTPPPTQRTAERYAVGAGVLDGPKKKHSHKPMLFGLATLVIPRSAATCPGAASLAPAVERGETGQKGSV